MSALTLSPAPPVLDADATRTVRRRIALIWGLLFFNVIEVGVEPTVFPIPHLVARVLTQAVLLPAVLLAVSVNRRLVFRPNWFLTIASILAVGGLLISTEVSTLHGDLRAMRVIVIVIVLWLLTPWWGRDDLLIARIHLRCLLVVLGSTLLGLALSPSKALAGHGRLAGSIWPIPPTQIAHYAAITAGISGVMFLAGAYNRRAAAVVFLGSVTILLLTHTRTALVAMLVALLLAALSLVGFRRRARAALLVFLLAALVVGAFFRPQVTAWATRGENTTELSDLTGRTLVWTALENAPRTPTQVAFGFGLSNASFAGLPIDSSWLSLYQELGLFGDIFGGLMILALLLLAARRPRGPGRAVTLFLIIYCLIASFTETGLGLPSPYLLDLCAAAALLAPRRTGAIHELPDQSPPVATLAVGTDAQEGDQTT